MFNKNGKKVNAIVLVGMSGCGKTTIGRRLAHIYEKKFVDLDEYICEKYGETVNEMFAFSEVYFRTRERVCCKEVMSKKNFVLATGGGTPMHFDNIDYLTNNSIIVYVDRPYQLIQDTIDYSERPLLENNPSRVQELYECRHTTYMNIADFRVVNDGSLEDVIKKIKKEINFKHIIRN